MVDWYLIICNRVSKQKNQNFYTFSSIEEGLVLPSSLGFSSEKSDKLICICDDSNILDVISDFNFLNKNKTPASIFASQEFKIITFVRYKKNFLGRDLLEPKQWGK